MTRILISTGEVSGDLQGSLLVMALKKEAYKRNIELDLIAIGGPRIQAAGANLIANTASIGAIGLWEALPLILPIFQVQSKVDKFIQKKDLDAVVLIDYMGPNIRLGNKLRNSYPNIPIIYYIAPQEWAWSLGDKGTTDLIGFSNKILAIFRAEADFYTNRGGNVTWVGHPMLDTIKALPNKEDSMKKIGLNIDQKLLLIFPASRSQELKYVLPELLEAALKLQKEDSSLYVVLPSALPEFDCHLTKALENYGINGRVIPADETDAWKPILFAAADLAFAKSGTINMELAINNVPQIVAYKVSRITAFLARKLLRFRVEHISPVNLLLNERLIPELLQEELRSNSIVDQARPLLEKSLTRSSMLEGYAKLRTNLGEKGVTDRAAREVFNFLI